MRSAHKLALAGALTASLLAADRVPTADTNAGPAKVGQQAETAHKATVPLEALAAREAIAARYGHCAITEVVDYSKPGGDTKVRGLVQVTIEVDLTNEAIKQQQKYAKDNTVMWTTAEPMAREHVPGQRGERALGKPVAGSPTSRLRGNATSLTFPLYPTDGLTGNVGVFIGADARTFDRERGKAYYDFHAKYCGTIAVGDIGDDNRWRLDSSAPPMEDVSIKDECDLVLDPVQSNVSQVFC